MKIVVLGGSGFMGSHLCDLLSSKGHKVNIFDIKKSKYKKKNQKMYIGSILDKKELSLAVRGCDFVYHFAALADLDIASNEPLKSAKINIVGERRGGATEYNSHRWRERPSKLGCGRT